MAKYTPPYPHNPHKGRLGLWGFLRVAHSWIGVLTDKSYSMLLGQFWLPAMRVFIVNDPQWVRTILVEQPQRYPKHKLMHTALEPLIGRSPFASSGEVWASQRAMLDQAFGYARLGLVLPLMQHACQDMLTGLAALGNAAGQTRQINASQVMTHVTADIIFRTIFSAKLELTDSNQLVSAFANYQRYAQLMLVCKLLRLPSLWFGRKRLAYAATIREFLELKVQARLDFLTTANEQAGRDILSGLRCATHADTGLALSKAQLVDQVCMLFLAGHETSSTALSWCVFILAQMPELQQQLREEVACVPLAEVGRLRLMQAVVKEVLRLYPPVGYFPREATHEHTIRGSKVRVGDALLVFPWLLHRHRKWWLQPEAFDPQRFLTPRTGPAASAYMPFGAGPRACMGAGFAMQEIALVLAELLKHYQVLPVPGFEPEVVGRLTVKPSLDIQVLLQPIQAGSANCDARVTPQ